MSASKTSQDFGSTPRDVSFAVVIPTRNRSDLAINAIRSLLDQPGFPVEVLVSDNSTSPEDVRKLETFCRTSGDARLVYTRPPGLLPMGEHWDWAMQQALERSHASHFTIHYDRKISKPGQLVHLAHVAQRYPHQLIAYTVDFVTDDTPPSVLYQPPWTGKVYTIQTSRVLELSSKAMISEMGQAFPIFSNCYIPRPVLEQIRDRFGSVCNSTVPDACFTYRFCALNDSYLNFDRPLGILYASYLSNGLGYFRNRTDGSFGDFRRSLGDRPWLEAAPIPGLTLGQNVLYNEYVLVQRTVGSTKMPAIDMDGYLRDLAAGLRWIEDPRARDALREMLKERGWREEQKIALSSNASKDGDDIPKVRRSLYSRLTPGRLLAAARVRIKRKLRRQRWVLFMADHFGIKPHNIHCFTFCNTREALHYALTYPRRRETENPYTVALMPSELDFGTSEAAARV